MRTIYYTAYTKQILLICFILFAGKLAGQDIEKIKGIKNITKKKPFEFGGAIGIGASYYNSNAILKRSAPYNWYISGSPTVKLYGVAIPFTFTYSETGRSLSHPFHYNFTGASPYYKWATLHVGFRSMNFSDYTVSGVMFNGIGMEMSPGILRFGAFYGVFNPAIEADTSNGNFGVVLPSYKRIGYGIKLGIGNTRNYFDLVLFRGKDDEKSLRNTPSFSAIKPADNVTFGPRFKVTLFKKFFIESDLALSVYTRNVLNDTLPETEDLRKVYQLIRVNTTSFGAFAGHVALGVNFNAWGINVRARQVSSDYQSMGINLLQDDIREYTVNPNFRIWKGKIGVGGSYGLYSDNISNKRINTTVRSIYNTSLNVNPGGRINFGLGYSNFGTTRTNGLVQLNDSITFSIINESYNGNIGINLGTNKKPIILALFAQYQKADDRNVFTQKFNNSEVINAGANSQYKFSKSKIQIGGGLAYANFTAGGKNFNTYNSMCSVKKSFLKSKLTSSINLNYSQRFNEGIKQGDVMSVNTTLQTQIGKHNNFQFQFRLMRNTTGIVSNTAFNEQRASIQYGFSF